MSIAAIAWALRVKTGSPSAKLVLIKLADNANDEGRCWPSVRHIVDHTELSERAVREHIKTLVSGGLVTIEKRFSDGVQLPNVYLLNLRENVGVVHQVQGGGAAGAPGVVQEVQGNSKPSKINRHLNHNVPADAGACFGQSHSSDFIGKFEAFFLAFPNKTARRDAIRSYRAALTRGTAEEILAGAVAYAEVAELLQPRFVCTAAKWLDGDRWLDTRNGKTDYQAAFRSPEEAAAQNAARMAAYGKA